MMTLRWRIYESPDLKLPLVRGSIKENIKTHHNRPLLKKLQPVLIMISSFTQSGKHWTVTQVNVTYRTAIFIALVLMLSFPFPHIKYIALVSFNDRCRLFVHRQNHVGIYHTNMFFIPFSTKLKGYVGVSFFFYFAFVNISLFFSFIHHWLLIDNFSFLYHITRS